jgi:transposase
VHGVPRPIAGRGPARKYSEEVRALAVRRVRVDGAKVAEVARELGIGYESLRRWVRAAEARDADGTAEIGPAERQRLSALERENRELRRANELLRSRAEGSDGAS